MNTKNNTFLIQKKEKKSNGLVIQGPQYYMALKYHMEEAIKEKNIYKKCTPCPPIAIFSKKYYNEINKLNHNKIYDFCFIGSIHTNKAARQWVIDFAKKYFTCNSIFINTDTDNSDYRNAWKQLGDYDYSHKNVGFFFRPKGQQDNQSKSVQYRIIKENKDYFTKMCQTKFVLCPAGDANWSFRFYEVLMCKSIPIVESWHHTYRTKEEADIKYKYILSKNVEKCIKKNIPYNNYVNKNTIIFENYHLLK